MINFSPITNARNISAMAPASKININSADSVSFGGKYKKVQSSLSENSKAALEFGEQVFWDPNFTYGNIKTYIEANLPDTEVLPIEELKEKRPYDWQNYSALVNSDFAPDFTKSSNVLYIAKSPKNDDETGRLLYSMTMAHEYTHLLQNVKDDKLDAFLKTATKGNCNEALAIMAMGEAIFTIFDNEIQARSALGFIRKHLNVKEFEKYGMVTPVGAKASREEIFAGTNSKNWGEFNKKLDAIFDESYKEYLTQFKQTGEGALYLHDVKDWNKFYKDVRKYCSIKAEQEKEAYTTESALAKKVLRQSDLNIDIFPIYYELLQNRFKN